MIEKQEEKIRSRLEKTSARFRIIFLLKFTEQLIKHTRIEEFFKLENVLNKKERKFRTGEKNESSEELMPSILYSQPRIFQKSIPRPPLVIPQIYSSQQTPSQNKMPKGPLRIPEFPLPPTVQNIRPVPTSLQMDLGKLNPFIQNQRIMSIECNGPEENVTIKGSMGTQTTNIILNKEDIDSVLHSFSDATRIPIHEGVFKIAAGNLIISAIVSDLIGSKFIIRKMIAQPQRF